MTDSLTAEQKEDLVKLETTRAVLMKMLTADDAGYCPTEEEIAIMKEMFEKYKEYLLNCEIESDEEEEEEEEEEDSQ